MYASKFDAKELLGMKAAVLYKANQPMVIEEMELLDPQQGEVLNWKA